MKTFEINRNSWHYKLVEEFGAGVGRNLDFCSYIRRVFGAIIGVIVASVVVAGFTCAVADALAWLTVVIVYGVLFQPDFLGGLGLAIIIVTSICASGAAILHFKQKRRYRLEKEMNTPGYVEQQPSFPVAVYRKFKDKTCMKITVVGEIKNGY